MTNRATHDLSTSQMELVLQEEDGRLRLEQLSAGGFSWLHPSSPSGLFSVKVNGSRLDASNLRFDRAQEEPPAKGVRQVRLSFGGQGIVV